MLVQDLAYIIRPRVNDSKKINYKDEEIVADIATACRLLSLILINRRSPEMMERTEIVDGSAVPDVFHSFVGQYPVWREGNIFRTSRDEERVEICYWVTRGQDITSMTDKIPFDDIYQDAICKGAEMLLLNRDEFDTTQEQSILQTMESYLPPLGDKK